jgi:hypothetical protein
LQSGIFYLGNVAKAHRLKELAGQPLGAQLGAHSIFVIKGADQCAIDASSFEQFPSGSLFQIECSFPADHYTIQDLFLAVKAAFPELMWDDISKSGQSTEEDFVEDSNVRISVVRYFFDQRTVHVYIKEKPTVSK